MAESTPWKANFRDLNAAVIRMGTLADGGRITLPIVREEIERLRESWRCATVTTTDGLPENNLLKILGHERMSKLDHFDRV